MGGILRSLETIVLLPTTLTGEDKRCAVQLSVYCCTSDLTSPTNLVEKSFDGLAKVVKDDLSCPIPNSPMLSLPFKRMVSLYNSL